MRILGVDCGCVLARDGLAMKRFVLVLLFGLGTALGQDAVQSAAYQQACGSVDQKVEAELQPVAAKGAAVTPDAGQALLYLIEDQDEIGAACVHCGVTVRLGADGRWVGVTNGNSYAAVSLAPGVHHLCANWQSHLKKLSHREIYLMPLDVEAGKVYYMRVHVMDAFNSTVMALSLEALNEDEGKMLLEVDPRSVVKK